MYTYCIELNTRKKKNQMLSFKRYEHELFKILINSCLLNFLFLSLSNFFIMSALKVSSDLPGCEEKKREKTKHKTFNSILIRK